ncbi:MAG: SOS response-associated peptidase [Gemmatimonadetes bacterium]|nr:SOS response-associated peptidase [Gemmatimonadota bacterium]
MCGRYTLTSDADEVVEVFDVPPLAFAYRPRYNIAPGQEAPVVARDRGGRRMGLMRWGLVPAWADEESGGFINARSESVARTPSFRDAFRRRRCLVPADGFYEWRRDAHARTPFHYRPTAGGLLSFAGIWERWKRPGQEVRYGFAILTTAANGDVAPVHHRMPVVVAPDRREAWLDAGTPAEVLRTLLVPAPDGSFAARRVSTRVNSPEVDDATLLEAAEG